MQLPSMRLKQSGSYTKFLSNKDMSDKVTDIHLSNFESSFFPNRRFEVDFTYSQDDPRNTP